MMRWLVVCALLTFPVWAKDAKGFIPPMAVTAANLDEYASQVQTVRVEVQLGKGPENPQWSMSHTVLQVWLGKLIGDNVSPVADNVLKATPAPSSGYKGLKVMMSTIGGKKFEPLTIQNGRITSNGKLVKTDTGRAIEYWLFSTARVKRDWLLGPQVLPVLTFEQCRLLGMQVVETEPRQCLLPDGTILLDVPEKPTLQSLRITDFAGCLKHGKGLINTFPVRCVVAGGRVFAEPPQALETPADAPLADGVDRLIDTPVTPTAPSPTMVTQPLLGTYAVSGSGLISPTSITETLNILMQSPTTAVSDSGIISLTVPNVSPAAGPRAEKDLRTGDEAPDYRNFSYWQRLKLQLMRTGWY